MFPVTLRPGHVGLFISVFSKNTTWLDVSFLIYCLRKGFVERMPVSCYVINYTNRFTKASGLFFFRFPESEAKQTAWINGVRRKDWTPSKSSRSTCILH